MNERRAALACLDVPQARLRAGPADLDIGAKPPRSISLPALDKVRLAVALEDLFGVNRLDLVLLPDADPFLAGEYDLYILHRAGGLAPLERECLALSLGKVSDSGSDLEASVGARLVWIRQMLAEIRRLPLDDRGAFLADWRNVWRPCSTWAGISSPRASAAPWPSTRKSRSTPRRKAYCLKKMRA